MALETTEDLGGGHDVTGIGNGDHIAFKDVDFGTRPTRVDLRLASGVGSGGSGLIVFRQDAVDGPILGKMAIGNTGGWQSWKAVPAGISGAEGVHDLYVTFETGYRSDYVNMNWFRFNTDVPSPGSNRVPVAVAESSVAEGDLPLVVDFDATNSVDVDGEIVSYEWDFGDGATATGATVSHTYTTEGRFTARLVVTDDQGATGADQIDIRAGAIQLGNRILAAGDIAHCGDNGDEETALLLDREPDAHILTLGDAAYGSGSDEDFACFHQSWGKHKERISPAPGNHEYGTTNASGYFNYFGAAAGDPAKGYYSFDIGAWHVVSLNSNCSEIGGCDIGSPQHDWLSADLAANPAQCTLAYMHHPRFSSGSHGDDDDVQDLWATLADSGAEMMLAGHDHDYERFTPMNAAGQADPNGMRMFVVGTGGTGLRSVGTSDRTEASDDSSHGLLGLNLSEGSYDWEFLPVAGDTYTDSGTTGCH